MGKSLIRKTEKLKQPRFKAASDKGEKSVLERIKTGGPAVKSVSKRIKERSRKRK